MNTYAIILAAGLGKRMGADQSKLFLQLTGKPLLAHTLETFEQCADIQGVVLVVPADSIDEVAAIAKDFQKIRSTVAGGAERQDSVREGLKAVPDETDIIAVHDGARPLVLASEIEAAIEAARETGAAVVGQPLSDTIKRVDRGTVVETLDRSKLWAVQTPQVFQSTFWVVVFYLAGSGVYQQQKRIPQQKKRILAPIYNRAVSC